MRVQGVRVPTIRGPEGLRNPKGKRAWFKEVLKAQLLHVLQNATLGDPTIEC